MCSSYQAPLLRTLYQSTAIVLLTGLLAGCSNDALRLEEGLTTNASLSSQQPVVQTQQQVPQAYPGDVDPTTTASVTRAPSSGRVTHRNGIRVIKRPTVQRSSRSGRGFFDRFSSPPKAINDTNERFVERNPAPVSRSVAPVQSQPLVLAPRNTSRDTMTTGSIRKVPTSTRSGQGWTGAGGTWVTVRQGETMHNLSRRYGVPVDALQKANNMVDPNSLTAGSKVLIPAYTYSKSAKVSAPDHDPITKVSRASKGMRGEPINGHIAVPKNRGSQPMPKVSAVTPVQAPSAGSGVHVVQSGDTLYSISRRYNVSTAAVASANGLSGSTVRLGQKLKIPSSSGSSVVASRTVDPITTSSVPKVDSKGSAGKSRVTPVFKKPVQQTTIASRSTEKVQTAAKTTSSTFRWPISGRVIAKFGERVNGSVNDGIDISVPEGTPVKAAENGTVIYSGSELADFGNLILVSHDGGWVSAYAHASRNNVKRGDKVNRGQVIAMSGKTGNATSPKLHFELRKDSKPVNPLKHLSR